MTSLRVTPASQYLPFQLTLGMSHETGPAVNPFTIFFDYFLTRAVFTDYEWITPDGWPTDIDVVGITRTLIAYQRMIRHLGSRSPSCP